jgi:hypothetical protein
VSAFALCPLAASGFRLVEKIVDDAKLFEHVGAFFWYSSDAVFRVETRGGASRTCFMGRS